MRRRDVIMVFVGASFTWPLAARAQRSGEVPTVGVLYLGSEESFQGRLEAFRNGLQSNGLSEGKSVRLAMRYANGDVGELARLARELEAAGSVLIVTSGRTSVQAVRTALPNMPIVMAPSADPVGAGFARSLSRPGGKITGVSILGSELSGKRFQLLKEIVPTAKTFAVLFHPANPGNEVFLKNSMAIAEVLGIEIKERAVTGPDEISDAMAWAARLPAGGVYVGADPVFTQHKEAIFRTALAARLPTMTPDIGYVRAGALVAYGPDSLEMRRQAAGYVAAILRGAEAGDLPIAQPTKFELVINLKTARALGLTVPVTLLARADEVIE
ncbi:ABC transporter substrate-binding protein [Vineibacter terrae]|uniref:ABC transporter substrate-binding protein n=1 Tax=Vineibacter terrae TaxID=2586908 RepID=A0A5C8PDU2_9HYPH|nr:ABC transporter substrate-binding protein [Vineibacter terrae]TXL71764.1 ABC transporter substrate-binding protein [Vineibacter terrae]